MKTERFCLILVNGLLLACGLFFIHACTTFDKAFRKYGTTAIDTTYQTVTLTVPKDSVTHVFRTDTTHYIERIRQGRATVTIIREPTNTTVIANCDSAQMKTKVVVQTKRQLWGVDPKFEKSASIWRTVAFVLIGLIGAGVIAYILTHKYQLSLAKR